MSESKGQRRYTQTSLEHFRLIGWGKEAKWKNGQIKKEGYPPVKRHVIKNVSEYDPEKWGKPEYPPGSKAVTIAKEIPKIFCLNVKDDIVDLCYKERVIPFNDKTFIAHDYLCSELEHRAWEKWGGPEGLKVARQRKAILAARARARKQGLNPDDPANQLQIKPLTYETHFILESAPGAYRAKDFPTVIKSVDPFTPKSHEGSRANYNYYDYDQFDPSYYEDDEDDDCMGWTPCCCRGWSPSYDIDYEPPTPTRARSSAVQAGPPVPITPMRRTPSVATSTGKGPAKVEDDSKPKMSTPIPSLPTRNTPRSQAKSVPKLEFEEQKPIVPSTPTPRSRSVRAKATPVKTGVKREFEADSEDVDNDSDDDFVPGQKSSHSAKKRKTKKV